MDIGLHYGEIVWSLAVDVVRLRVLGHDDHSV